MDTSGRSKNPMSVLTVTAKVVINEDAQVFVHDFDLFVTVRLLDETPAQTGIFISVENGETPRLANNGKSTTCTVDNFVLLVVPGLSSVPAAVCLQHRDQRISKIIPEIWDCYQIQSRLEVISMHAGNRCWKILTSRPPETMQGGSNARHSWFDTALHSSSLGPGVHVFAHSSERVNSDSEGDASKVVTKMEAQYSYSLLQIPKEIHSMNRRDWWHENSRAQKWISEQSPTRCRGTRSHHWVDITRVKPKFHRRWRRFYERFLEPLQKLQVIYMIDLLEFGKYCEECSWNHRTAKSHRLETRNWRTSCTSSKRVNISRIIAIWIEWRLMVRFHEMFLLSTECPKPPGKWEISDMNEDPVNHSKDQLHYLTHWLDISQNSEQDEARIHQCGKKLSQGFFFFGYALFAREEYEKRILWPLTLKNWDRGDRWSKESVHRNFVHKTEYTRNPDNPADGSAKLSGRNYEFQEPLWDGESTVRREILSGESHGDREEFQLVKKQHMTEESTRILGLTQKLGKNFIYRHHIETRSSIARAEKRNISYSTELLWCHQVNSCKSGDCTRKENLWLFGCRREQKSVRFVDWISQDLNYWTKLVWKGMTNPGGIDENSDDITSRSYMAWCIDKNFEKANVHTGNRCSKITRAEVSEAKFICIDIAGERQDSV